MRGIGRRMGAVGVRRRDQFVGGSVSVPGYTQIYNAVSTITPAFCWWFGDDSLLTLVGVKISVAQCAWGSGHNLTQNTDANRLTYSAGRSVSTLAGNTYMNADVTVPIDGAYLTLMLLLNPSGYVGDPNSLIWNDGANTVNILGRSGGNQVYRYLGADRGTKAATTGDQCQIYELSKDNVSRILRNDVVLDTGLSYGDIDMSSYLQLSRNGQAFSGNYLCVAGFVGIDATDTAALMAVGTDLMGV